MTIASHVEMGFLIRMVKVLETLDIIAWLDVS